MKKSVILFMFFTIVDFQCFSQTVPSTGNSGQIRVYDAYQPKNGSSYGAKNKISINPFSFLIGDYPLYYEHMFGSTFSIEVGAGVTHENFLRRFTDFQTSATYTDDEVIRTYQLGNTYSISPKIYLDDDCFEGSYIALYYRHRLYNSEVSGYEGNSINPVEEYARINSFTFNYGYVFHLVKNFMLDYYVGLGLRTSTVSQFTANYTPINTYPYNTYTYSAEYSKQTLPTGVMGLKLGYVF